MAAHALLGPSSASRWLTCPPSARLSENYDDKGSEAAAEGTTAHRLAEIELSFLNDKLTSYDYKRAIVGEIHPSRYYNAAMSEHVSNYVTYVMECYNDARESTKDAQIFLETRVDFSHIVPEGFGTSDVSIVADGVLDVIDFKYGKGVLVEAIDNPQLKLYALGLLHAWAFLYDIHTVRLHIYQPRVDNISVWEISVEELNLWADTYAKPRAQQAWIGEGEFNPNEKACKFCKAKGRCKALATFAGETVRADVKPGELTPAETSEVLKRATLIIDWVTAIQADALYRAIEGETFPGFKVVEGRSNRKIADEAKAEIILYDMLSDRGYDRQDLLKPKSLKSLTELELLIGKKQLSEILGELIVKPEGKPTLAPESDKRAAWSPKSSAADDFKDF